MDIEDLWAEADEDEGKQDETKRLARVISIITLMGSQSHRACSLGAMANTPQA
jgi:hypothetical protein